MPLLTQKQIPDLPFSKFASVFQIRSQHVLSPSGLLRFLAWGRAPSIMPEFSSDEEGGGAEVETNHPKPEGDGKPGSDADAKPENAGVPAPPAPHAAPRRRDDAEGRVAKKPKADNAKDPKMRIGGPPDGRCCSLCKQCDKSQDFLCFVELSCTTTPALFGQPVSGSFASNMTSFPLCRT